MVIRTIISPWIITLLLIKVTLCKTVYVQSGASFDPQQMTMTKRQHFHQYVAVLNNLKKDLQHTLDVRHVSDRNLELSDSIDRLENWLPSSNNDITINDHDVTEDKSDESGQFQTMLLRSGLGATKRFPAIHSKRKPQTNRMFMERTSRVPQMQMLAKVDPAMINLVLKQWRPRLEESLANNENSAENQLNLNHGGSDISVNLDLDALSRMVGTRRREGYQAGKIQSALRKLNKIG